MEHRTDSTPSQSHGCLVALVLFTALLAAFACTPAPPRPITGKPKALDTPSISDEEWEKSRFKVPEGALSRGRMRGVSHNGPKPKPRPGDYYVGEFQVQVLHRLDRCDRLVGADPWSLRYFRTVKAAKAQRFRNCSYCMYPDYR